MSYNEQYSPYKILSNRSYNSNYYSDPNRQSMQPLFLKERNKYLKQNMINEEHFVNKYNYYHNNFPIKEPDEYHHPHSHLHNVIHGNKCNNFPRKKAEKFRGYKNLVNLNFNTQSSRYYPEFRDYEFNYQGIPYVPSQLHKFSEYENTLRGHPIKKNYKYDRADYLDEVYQQSSKYYPESTEEIYLKEIQDKYRNNPHPVHSSNKTNFKNVPHYKSYPFYNSYTSIPFAGCRCNHCTRAINARYSGYPNIPSLSFQTRPSSMKRLYENQENLIQESQLLKHRRLSHSPDERLNAINSFDLVTQHINKKNYERQKMLEYLKGRQDYNYKIQDTHHNGLGFYNCNDFSDNQCSSCLKQYSKKGDKIYRMAEKIPELEDSQKLTNYESSFKKFEIQSQRHLPYASNLYQYSNPKLNYNYKYGNIENLASKDSEFAYNRNLNLLPAYHEVYEPSGEKIYNKALKVKSKDDYLVGLGYNRFSNNYITNDSRNNSYSSTLCNYTPSKLNYNYRYKYYVNPIENKSPSKVKEYYNSSFYKPINSYSNHIYSGSTNNSYVGDCICERPCPSMRDCYCYKNHSDPLCHQKLRDEDIIREFRREIIMK